MASYPKNDITGQRFGKLVVLYRDEDVKRHKNILWACQCDCGNITHAAYSDLNRGRKKSCGCLLKLNGRKPGQPAHWKTAKPQVEAQPKVVTKIVRDPADRKRIKSLEAQLERAKGDVKALKAELETAAESTRKLSMDNMRLQVKLRRFMAETGRREARAS